jgi:hypothetical protein
MVSFNEVLHPDTINDKPKKQNNSLYIALLIMVYVLCGKKHIGFMNRAI